MKKIVIGSFIAVVFVVYSLVLRHQHSAPVIAPLSLSQNNTPAATNSTSASNSASSSASSTNIVSSTYKDGTYTGSIENAFYGNVQIAVTIASGKISAVNFLEYPNDNPNSINVNQQAIPYLKQEAIQAQGANVDIVTGATYTSQAFTQSLSNALDQAKQS